MDDDPGVPSPSYQRPTTASELRKQKSTTAAEQRKQKTKATPEQDEQESSATPEQRKRTAANKAKTQPVKKKQIISLSPAVDVVSRAGKAVPAALQPQTSGLTSNPSPEPLEEGEQARSEIDLDYATIDELPPVAKKSTRRAQALIELNLENSAEDCLTEVALERLDKGVVWRNNHLANMETWAQFLEAITYEKTSALKFADKTFQKLAATGKALPEQDKAWRVAKDMNGIDQAYRHDAREDIEFVLEHIQTGELRKFAKMTNGYIGNYTWNDELVVCVAEAVRDIMNAWPEYDCIQRDLKMQICDRAIEQCTGDTQSYLAPRWTRSGILMSLSYVNEETEQLETYHRSSAYGCKLKARPLLPETMRMHISHRTIHQNVPKTIKSGYAEFESQIPVWTEVLKTAKVATMSVKPKPEHLRNKEILYCYLLSRLSYTITSKCKLKARMAEITAHFTDSGSQSRGSSNVRRLPSIPDLISLNIEPRELGWDTWNIIGHGPVTQSFGCHIIGMVYTIDGQWLSPVFDRVAQLWRETGDVNMSTKVLLEKLDSVNSLVRGEEYSPGAIDMCTEEESKHILHSCYRCQEFTLCEDLDTVGEERLCRFCVSHGSEDEQSEGSAATVDSDMQSHVEHGSESIDLAANSNLRVQLTKSLAGSLSQLTQALDEALAKGCPDSIIQGLESRIDATLDLIKLIRRTEVSMEDQDLCLRLSWKEFTTKNEEAVAVART